MSLLPNLPALPDSLSNALNTPASAPASSPSSPDLSSPTTAGSILDSLGIPGLGSAGNLLSNLMSASANTAAGTSSQGTSISWARVAAFVVGILLIGGGILMFRQSQVIIQSTVRTAGKATKHAAETAGAIAAL